MDQLFTASSGDHGKSVNLEALGKELNITSVGEEMRYVICPACDKKDIVEKKVSHLKCVCGVIIEIEERWYE